MKGLNKLKRLIVFCIVMTMSIGSITGFAYAGTAGYSDLSRKHWAYENIVFLSDEGIVSGYPDGSFRPSRTVTYGEFIKMVYTACTGKDADNGGRGEHWATNYYFASQSEGYFKDDVVSEGMLGKEIPRKHMAHIAASVVKSLEDSMMENVGEKAAAGGVSDYELFNDITEISENSYDIMTACRAGILNGYEDGSFGPDRTLTRAEAATVISRLFSYSEGAKLFAAESSNQIAEEDDDSVKESSKETGETIVRKAETNSGIVPVIYDVYKGNMSDMGIEKVEQISSNTINIYSAVKHDFVFLMMPDGGFVKPVGFPSGNCVEKDGYYLYVADPEGRDISGEKVYFMFEDSDIVYEFEDLTIFK